MAPDETLLSFLRRSDAFLGYTPFEDEPAYAAFVISHGLGDIPSSSVPADKDTDPHVFAEEVVGRYAGKKLALFVPGRMFDRKGTRHGRGVGWYDRFLSGLPASWVRIGVADPSLLHETLQRKSWDEPVDFVLIADGASFEVVETGARMDALRVVEF